MSGVTVIIPTWNRRDLLVRVMECLQKQTHPIEKIIVADDGSTDGSAEAAEERGATVLRMGTNAGFARAVNRGIAGAATEWVAIVNNDVEPEPDWLACLVAAAAGAGAWFAAGKLFLRGHPARLDGTFDLVCRGGCAWRAGHGKPDSGVFSQPRRIAMTPFTAALFRKELFGRVGLLDEEFGSYLEDVEFGFRCAASGYDGVYVPDARAAHEGSATLGAWSGESVRLIARNQLLLIAKHFPRGWFRRFGWPVLVAQALWGVLALRHGAGPAWLRGKWQGLRRFNSVRKRSDAVRDSVAEFLGENDREILKLQRAGGFDSFWRWYFALT